MDLEEQKKKLEELKRIQNETDVKDTKYRRNLWLRHRRRKKEISLETMAKKLGITKGKLIALEEAYINNEEYVELECRYSLILTKGQSYDHYFNRERKGQGIRDK